MKGRGRHDQVLWSAVRLDVETADESRAAGPAESPSARVYESLPVGGGPEADPYESNRNRLRSNKLGLELRLAVFEKHLQNLAQILAQFFHRRSLTVCTSQSWHVAHKKPRVGTPLNDSRECPHPFLA